MSQLKTLALVCVTVAGCGDEPRLPLAWGIGVASFDSAELGLGVGAPDPLSDVAAIRRLTIPTYDGSGQAVHPDLLREPDRLLMAITPYPYSDDLFENPSLIVTTDGTRFSEPSDGLNPLVDAPPIDHNDDPDLRRDPVTGEYELLYLETLRPERQTLVALRSPDLATWSRQDAIVYDLAAGDSFIVSPAAIVEAGVTHLYYVDLIPSARIVELTSSDGRTWDKALAKPVALELGAVTPWHLDVIRGEQGFAMLISGYDEAFVHQDLYLATSPDLASWTLAPAPLLAHTDAALDVESLYRSTGVVSGDTLVVWYSMQYAP
jgi:hypothetical protein